jgi:hypothetical protein
MEKKKVINYTEKAITSIMLIGEKEPEFMVALAETLNHLANTYNDKYEGGKSLLDTKQQLYDKDRGGIINSYQISRYLQRFMTKGFKKSGNKNDMMKVIHYALFDIVRMNLMPDTKNVDIVDGMSDEEFKEV